MTTETKIQEPSILTANTYFWTPAGNANQRRRNEENRQSEVANFFEAIGLSVTRNGDTVKGEAGGLVCTFHYRESCKNVYKSFSVTRNGNRSNIKAIRKYY